MYNKIIEQVSQIAFKDAAKIILSGTNAEFKKITLRPIIIKNVQFWQIEKHSGKKAFHSNIEFSAVASELEKLLGEYNFSDINLFTTNLHTSYRVSKRGKLLTNIKRIAEQRNVTHSHNRQKNYILAEGMAIPALVDLGVFSSTYHIVKGKHDKFVQINKFAEIIDANLKDYTGDSISIVDFGSGKSYLTFIVYYYFSVLRGIKTTIIGYDINAEIVEQCNAVAQKYNYSDINFIAGDISKMQKVATAPDMLITLHACDTATDHALSYAIKNKIKYIFSVPCCQQEINAQIKFPQELKILGTHGLYKERFSSILTDTIRAEALKQHGYDVDAVEFVGFSTTPKNAMLRAKLVKDNITSNINALKDLCAKFDISQTLLNIL